MNLIDFIPMFIRQDENMRPKGVVTAARWNELWDLAILQGDHSEEAIQTLVAEVLNRYTKLESDALLAGNTNDLVKTVDVNLTTGVITITKKDGTITTFDTALEKVPATFEIIESAGKFYLKITNVDGTTSQTDLTNLMDVYNYNNTATVSFVKSGTGNVKTITAEVRDASIGLEKLSITAISQIESWANTASNGAATATTQANTATTKATEAAASAVTASSKATEASGSAQTATNKAGEASTSAANALSSANSAAASASTATTKTSEVVASATAANTSKNQAATSATNAATSEANALVSKNAAAASATDANTKATAAATSATNANNSANAAASSAASAAGSAATATTKANEADASADAAALSAASAQGIDTLSRSYAVGGTGTRPGEDTDNAKYYKDQAAAIVGGDYVTQTELTNGLATKVDTVAGKQLSTEDYTTAEKTKLGTVATNANNYVHPTTAGNKHIPTGGSVGQILKNTASGTATWQAEYSHPANHAPSIISQDANNRFVTDDQISAWNNKADAGASSYEEWINDLCLFGEDGYVFSDSIKMAELFTSSVSFLNSPIALAIALETSIGVSVANSSASIALIASSPTAMNIVLDSQIASANVLSSGTAMTIMTSTDVNLMAMFSSETFVNALSESASGLEFMFGTTVPKYAIREKIFDSGLASNILMNTPHSRNWMITNVSTATDGPTVTSGPIESWTTTLSAKAFGLRLKLNTASYAEALWATPLKSVTSTTYADFSDRLMNFKVGSKIPTTTSVSARYGQAIWVKMSEN